AGVGFFCISSASFTSGAQTRNNRVVAIGRWF
ncbi:phage tail protein, partial [Pseudomonas aeruginosa]